MSYTVGSVAEVDQEKRVPRRFKKLARYSDSPVAASYIYTGVSALHIHGVEELLHES
jgi:hypothetical protein